jgi:hypothetical protein
MMRYQNPPESLPFPFIVPIQHLEPPQPRCPLLTCVDMCCVGRGRTVCLGSEEAMSREVVHTTRPALPFAILLLFFFLIDCYALYMVSLHTVHGRCVGPVVCGGTDQVFMSRAHPS